MTDYEHLFIHANLGQRIRWNDLEPFIILGYAALFFQQVAKDRHDYDKEPLLEVKKTNFVQKDFSSTIVKSNEHHYLVPSDYFMGLINQSPFFEKLHQQQIIYHLTYPQLFKDFHIEKFENAHEAYLSLKKIFNHQVYYEEIEHICELAKPYCQILDEKQKLSDNIYDGYYLKNKTKI